MSTGRRAAWLVVLGGVAAALHVGKLPPALPILRDALGVSLVQAGFLLSLVQLAGMSLGLLVGLGADAAGLKRTMVAGLALVGAASLAGGFARSAEWLLVLRGVEGLGFLLASMPAPGLIRRFVPQDRMSAMLGVWGAYMPFATAAALLAGPAWMGWAGWQGWWWLLGLASCAMAAALWQALPNDPPALARSGQASRVRQTLSAPGPWLVALAFGAYSAQWLAVIGFLPSIYRDAGFDPRWSAVATALAAGMNIAGNLVAGRLLQRGVPMHRLLVTGFATMGLAALLAFGPWLPPGPWGSGARYAAVLAFSSAGGMVPSTLFSLAVRLAPSEATVSATVGWMQQWSAIGQFAGPPLVAWVAERSGGWQWSGLVTAACAMAGIAIAWSLHRLRPARAH